MIMRTDAVSSSENLSWSWLSAKKTKRANENSSKIVLISGMWMQLQYLSKKKKKSSQPKLKEFLRLNDADAANHAVAQWVIAHDISPNTLKGPYWQNMNKKLVKVSPCYKPMYPRKVFSEMLPKLKEMAKRKLQQHLAHRPSIGRTLTGDGATKQVSLINFLVYVPGKGVELVDVTDCSEHMSEGGTKDSM